MKKTISNNTQMFLDCLVTLEDAYSKMNDALTAMYGDKQAEEFCYKCYRKKHQKVVNVVQKFLCLSIGESISCDSNEI